MDQILDMPPPPDGDQDRGASVYGFYWAILAIATVVTSLRFWARIRIHALGWDDWLMLLAVLQLLGVTVAGTMMALDGGCRHLYYIIVDLGPEQVVLVNKLFYIAQPFAIMGLATGRMSVAALVLRIMGTSYWRKRFLWFAIATTFTISLVNSVLLFTACTPAEAVWNFLILTATCWNPVIMTDVTIASSSWNVFIDVCLALIPITLFWNLKLGLQKRVALSFLMSGGLLAAVCGAVKTSKLPETNETDATWATYDLLLWNGAETILVIICGSLPTLKPLHDMYFSRRAGSGGSSYPSNPSQKKMKSYGSSFPSRSTGDEAYTRLEPLPKPVTDPTVIEVAHRVDVEIESDRGSEEIAMMNQAHRNPWDRVAVRDGPRGHDMV
ncbi:hypothetical protein MMC13_006630 [Lambiella insularis]|nr:hypothetical protein [Lambiella insularis]